MTIAAAYLTSEGVVLGADSATTITAQLPGAPPGVVQMLRHSQKVFEVGEKGRFGLCTWGSGSLAGVSHRTVVARLADRIVEAPNMTVANAAEELVRIAVAAKATGAADSGDVGYFLGGWNLADHAPECYQIGIPGNGKAEMKSFGMGVAVFSGAPKFFTRAFRGFDPELQPRLADALRKRLPEVPEQFESLCRAAFEEATAPLVAAGFKDLPVREAIDYIHSYLYVTVKAYKFAFGAPICGGPIEVAFVSTDRKFRWVRHKRFDSAIGEEEGSGVS